MGQDVDSAIDASQDGAESDTFEAVLRAVAAAPAVALDSGSRPRLAEHTLVDDTFRIEAVLGQGAMGVVYLATDLALDRRVALKLHAASSTDPRGSRMWREAKAMARLAHPNVLTVHEVGVFGDRVYIAMELVDGGTVRQWLQTPRSWREVLGVFIQAARGLAAAHAVGLVHRDFKPTNVLIGADGRVRVADFGLARAADDLEGYVAVSRPPMDERSPSASPTLDAQITATGTALGTPAYMAPEQFSGARADQRTDQYAFCVSLHEALFGVRPATPSGTNREGPGPRPAATRSSAAGRVPGWLRAVTQRGLASEPADRFPSMDALVAALRADPTPRRRAALAGVGAGLVALGVWGADAAIGHRGRERCRTAAARIDTVWNDTSHAQLRAAFLATDVAYAANTVERMAPHLAQYAQDWRQRYDHACVAAEVLATAPPDRWAAGQACLEDRREDLRALLAGFAAAPDAATIQHAVPAIASLGRLATCDDDDWLERHPQRARAAFGPLRGELRRAGALFAAGHYNDALGAAQAVLAASEGAEEGLRAAASILTGEITVETGDAQGGQTLLLAGFQAAVADDDDDRALEAATELVFAVGIAGHDHARGLQWAQVARGFVQRLHADDAWASAALHNNVGMIYEAAGRSPEALIEHTRALAIRQAALGPAHPDVAYSLNNIGTTHKALGRLDDAERALRQAAVLLEDVLGPDHPEVATAYNNLGSLYTEQGRFEDAEHAHRRALAAFQDGLGPQHALTATSLCNLGNTLTQLGRYQEAEQAIRTALEIRERTLGPADPGVGAARNHLGNLYLRQGRREDALREHKVALAIATDAFGPEHPRVAASHRNLAKVYEALGRTQDAARAYAQGAARP